VDGVDRFWARVSAVAPPLPGWALAACAVAALLLVGSRSLWRPARHAVTIAHEGAHGLVALAAGRRLSGIRLHSDTSGVTVSAGRPSGLGMVLTCAAGYTGPGLIGLGAAALLAAGHAVGLLWALLGLLALLLVQIRNWYGLWSVLVTGGLVFAATWWLPAGGQTAFAHGVTWFLLLAAPRTVVELQAKRRRGTARDSDADQLARLTGLPGLAWVGVFLLVDVGALLLGTWWLLGASGQLDGGGLLR
jgi:Peptidase M50B-like